MIKRIDFNEIMEKCKELGQKKVKEIMSKEIVTVKEHGQFLEFATDIEMYNYLSFPVVNEDDEIVGIISQTDLLKLILFHGPTRNKLLVEKYFLGVPSIKLIMNFHPITLSPEDIVDEAAYLMFEHKIQSIPIIEKKKVVGVIGKIDIVSQILRTMGL
ncbi:CBS domain-containing protein [bacterium]|nr:CBS domain-containing protein [bacterium]MBU0899890.1 CBS domain-containing protein [bacterium]MBU1153237.1 CBS domain-containing protein [bacterium]MBU1781811.1 CBS domain-containing protein [bacterium]MBU2599185.1 CBS domain-containing protein [bacterium]